MLAPAPQALLEEYTGLCQAADPFALAEANINPLTGLSTDYLNHFSEAIMLLELIPSMPECRGDLLAWRALAYHQHFARSRLTQRELAMAAYDLAELPTRQRFDALCVAMNATVLAAQRAIATRVSDSALQLVSTYAVSRLKPLLSHASAVIHGDDIDFDHVLSSVSSQETIDAIIRP